jgi:DnaJ-class molecular chaperone
VIVVTVHHATRAAHATTHHLQRPDHPAAHADAGISGRVWLFLLVAGFVFAIAYQASLTRHPYRNCTTCRGSGRHRGAIFIRAFRACDACRGTGRQLRAGAKEPR